MSIFLRGAHEFISFQEEIIVILKLWEIYNLERAI